MTHHHQHHHLPALTLSILPICNYSSEVKQLPPIVTYEEVVKALADSSAVVIDVRQAEELERDGTIPGALHIPLADLEGGLKKIFGVTRDESTPLVFSCLAGIRSRKAQRISSKLGFTNTGNFEGGWMEWAEKNK